MGDLAHIVVHVSCLARQFSRGPWVAHMLTLVTCGGSWWLVAACGGLWSAQLASTIPPLSPCNATSPPSPCGIIYTTHGAGVDAGSPTWTGAYRSQVGLHAAFGVLPLVFNGHRYWEAASLPSTPCRGELEPSMFALR